MGEFLGTPQILPPAPASCCRWQFCTERRGKSVQSITTEAIGPVAEHSLQRWPVPRCSKMASVSSLTLGSDMIGPKHKLQYQSNRTAGNKAAPFPYARASCCLVLLFPLFQQYLVLFAKGARWIRYSQTCYSSVNHSYETYFCFIYLEAEWEGRSPSRNC